MVTLIESTVRVTTRQSDSVPIASVAAMALASRDDATGQNGRQNCGAGRPGHGRNPSKCGRITHGIGINLAIVAGNIAAAAARNMAKSRKY